jgi:hypothetical protein
MIDLGFLAQRRRSIRERFAKQPLEQELLE